MGKTLKTAGAIIGGAVLIATGVGAIAGLQVTAIGIAGIGTASISSLQMASAGLMAVGGMLDKPKSQSAALPTDWPANADQPTPFLFGRMGVSGKIVHRDEWGKDNHAQSFVHVFSGAGPVRAFVSFSADDVPITFASNGGSATGSRNGQMYRSWRLGAQPDTALSLPPMSGPAMPMWGAAYRLSGKACDLWTLTQDSKLSVYPGNAEPKPLSVIDGIYGYDPRYDSTYPGGMGACRLGVRSTYIWIENPIIAALNWSLGMVENGKIVGGVGVSPRGIDFPAFVDAANTADANGWKIAAWPDTSEDVSSVLDQMLQAGGAVRARHAGKISCVSRGAPRPSIVTITRQDTAGAIELDTGASRFNRLNTITPRFMSAAHKWQATPAAPVSFAAYVTEDGGRRSDLIDYRFVPAVKQAAELAAYDILDAREPFSGTIPLKPHLRQLKRGDCFTINEPDFVLNGVKCMVLSRGYDPKTGIVRVAFRSETDSKHPLALGKTTDLPAYPDLTPPDPTFVSPPEPGDVTVTPRPPTPGGQVPGFDLGIIVSNPTVTSVLVEFWEVPDGVDPVIAPPEDAAWQSAGMWPPTTTDVPINVQPGRWYWIGLTNRRGENASSRVVDGPHQSPGLVAGDLSPEAPVLEPIRADIEDVFALAQGTDEDLAAAEALLDALGTEVATARGGQPSLGANILALNQARIDGDNTNAQAISITRGRAESLAYADYFATYLFRDTLNDWTTANATLTAGSAFATYAHTGNDGQLLRSGLNFPGTRYTRVVIDLKRVAARTSGTWDGWLYWTTSGHGVSTSFRMASLTPDPTLNVRTEVVFDVDLSPVVTGATDWKASTINGFRIDLDQGLGGQFEIYSIRIVGADGSRLRSEFTTFQQATNTNFTAAGLRLTSLEATLDTPDVGLIARVQEVEGVAADAAERVATAFWTRETIAGLARTFMSARAIDDNGDVTADIDIGGRVIRLWNEVNGRWDEVTKIENGRAVFKGGVSAGGFMLTSGGIIWALAYRSQPFVRGDGETISFGAPLGAIPNYEFVGDNLLPRNPGEEYQLRLDPLTQNGGTVQAKILVPGLPAAQSLGPTSTVQSSGPRLQLSKSALPDTVDGLYTIKAVGATTVTVPAFTPEGTIIEGVATLDVYKLSGGVWGVAASIPVFWSMEAWNPGASSFPAQAAWTVEETVQLGSGATAVGLGARDGQVNTFTELAWMSAGTASGVRSALASGAKTTIRIIPQG